MTKYINVIGIVAFFILGLFSLVFCEESFTITTYYPSPYGSYNELTTTGNTYLATTSGKVGIGTTNPGAKLEVADTTRILSASPPSAPTTGKGIEIAYDERSEYDLGYILAIDRNGDVLQKLDIQGSPLLLNKKGGSVGIGTTSPVAGSKVTLAIDAATTAAVFYSGTYTDPHWMTAYDLKLGGSGRGLAVNGISYFASNVGIGTTSPSEKLQVYNGNLLIGPEPVGNPASRIYLYNSNSYIYYDGEDNKLKIGNTAGVERHVALQTNGVDRLFISGSTGNIGIGTAAPWAKLSVMASGSNTGVYGYSPDYVGVRGHSTNSWGIYCEGAFCGGTNAWSISSDERLKKNITTIENALEKVKKLRGVIFEWKNDAYKGKNIGFIAQELQKVVPEVVSQQPDGYYTAKTSELTSLLVEAIKEQQREIEELKTELKELK